MPFANYSKSKGTSKWGSSSAIKNDFDLEPVKRSINNAKLRIKDSGFNVEDTDQRNWFEKGTNLPQKQNWFFDTLELLNRPGQAVLNPIKERFNNDSESTLKNAWKGFSGQERARGSEVAESLGIENRIGKAIVGTGIDIGTDPLTYVPGGVLLKGAKGIGKGASLPVKAGYRALEKVSPKLKQVREEVVQPTYETFKDRLGYAFNDDYKATDTLSGGKSDMLLDSYNKAEGKRRYLQEEYSKNLTDTAKITGLDAGEQVGRVMEKNLKQFEDVPLSKDQLKQIDELQKEIDVTIPKYKEANQEARDLAKYHYAQVVEESQSPLIKSIKDVSGGKMIKTSNMSEIVKLPAWMKRKDGMAIDELADELGYKYADDLVQDLKAALSKKPLVKDIRNIAKERLLNDDYYKELIGNKESYKTVLDTMRKSKSGIQPGTKEIERIAREMPKDPKIQEAAKALLRSNNELRELARSEGIPINELEGYMTHILSREEKVRRKAKNISAIDRGNFGLGQPNKKILSERQLKGSTEDVNEATGRKFFEPNAYFATAQGQRRLIDYIQSVSFRKNVLNDPDFARPYVKGTDIPENAVVIDTNNYKFIKESGDLLEDVASKDIGGQYVVTKAAKQKLDKYKYTMTDEGSKAFLNTFDRLQSFWKRAALFSVPYHLRNDVGAKFNNWVGGMNAYDLAKYSKEADVDVVNAMFRGKETPLYNEYRQQGLGATSQSQVEFARRGADPDKAVERMVKERSKGTKGKVLDRLNPLRAFETSREFGDFIDQTNRFAAYKWAREKLKLSPKEAAKKTKEMQFDYTKLSNFERDFMARGIPFYRWMRNNLPYQLRQFANDPRKYEFINKARLNAMEAAGINEENVPEWMKESFSMPVTSDGKGSGKMLGFNLPLGDLTKMSDPLKMGIDSLTPVAKLPLELGINRNLFYNKPIEKFKGQAKEFNILGKKFNLAIKKAYALEQATGQIGRGLSGFLTKPESKDQDTKFRMPSFGISGVLKDFDANKANYFELRAKLKELQDYISYIEQQTGKRPRTVNEIN